MQKQDQMTVEFLGDVLRVLSDDTREMARRTNNLRAAMIITIVASGLDNLVQLLNTI